jgi:hypothetical protein
VKYDVAMEAVLAKGGELLFGSGGSACACRGPGPGEGGGMCEGCAGGAGAGAFITVPLRLEPQLLRLLDVQPFSSSATVSLAPSISVDGPPVKRKYNLGITGY